MVPQEQDVAAQDNNRKSVNASGWRAVVKRWRRNNRQRLNRLLTRVFGTTAPRQRPLAARTRQILVIRLNKRLGNILFLTPMLRTLADALPAASIDVLVQDPRHRPILESLPGVRHVFIQDVSVWPLVKLLFKIRRTHYDLAIDPSGNSTSNRLAMALCGARQRMGFASNSQWLRLTHAAGKPQSRHQAEQAVALLTEAVSGLDFDPIGHLAVFPDARADRAADARWQQALGCPQRPVIGFFVRATGNKQLPCDWWRAWRTQLREIAPEATLLQICPPGDTQAIAPEIARVAIAPLDELAALLSRLDVFVAADSGPMHLAAAAGVPVVGLFKATAVEAYAPLGRDCVCLTGERLTPEGAAHAVARLLNPNSRAAHEIA